MSFDLNGQTVIVTAAARGIGRAISRRFAERGARVSGWDLDNGPIAGDAAFVHGVTADMTAWAASPRCSFTTGQVLDVTCGRTTY